MTLMSWFLWWLDFFDDNLYIILFFSGIDFPVQECFHLCGRLLGPCWAHVCSVFSLLAVLGAAIVYWVLMSTFLFNSVDFFLGMNIWIFKKCHIISHTVRNHFGSFSFRLTAPLNLWLIHIKFILALVKLSEHMHKNKSCRIYFFQQIVSN